jgi:hypothetical protein
MPVHAAFEVRPGPESGAAGLWTPTSGDRLNGLIAFDLHGPPDGEGRQPMRGVVVVTGGSTSTVAEVEGTYDSGVLALEPTEMRAVGWRLRWERFELDLEDAHDDGIFDAGSGILDAEIFDIFDHVPIPDGVITVFADTLDATSTTRSRGFVSDQLFPYDLLGVQFSKPVRKDDVDRGLVLLINGEPAAAEVSTGPGIEIRSPESGHPVAVITGATLIPDVPIPYGADVSIDTSAITDLSGFAVSAPEDKLSAVPDLGPIDENLDFGEGFEGWHNVGARKEDAFECAEPQAGDQLVVFESRGRLVGALDLPEGAETISLDVTAFAELGDYPNDLLIVDVVTLEEQVIASAEVARLREDDGELIRCDAARWFQLRSEPIPLTLDVADAAGSEVLLRITLAGTTWTPFASSSGAWSYLSPPLQYAAAVENLTLHVE